jgi:hypothetical protein
MKTTKKVIILICILLPLTLMLYKSQKLNLPIIPREALDFWQVEIKANHNNLNKALTELPREIVVPVPTSTNSQTINSIEFSPERSMSLLQESDGGPVVFLTPEELKQQDQTLITAHIQLFELNNTQASLKTEIVDEFDQNKYKDLAVYPPQILEPVTKLSNTLVFSQDSQLVRLQKFFFYISDEVVLQPGLDTIEDTLTLSSGSLLGQAKLMTALARVNNIPARIAFGIQILEPQPNRKSKYSRVFYTEAYMNNKWVPINPHYKLFGQTNKNMIVLNRDSEKFMDLFNDRTMLSIMIEPLKFMSFSSEKFMKKLKAESPTWSYFSLHRFSLSVQTIFLGILLLPFGTVILSLCRVLLGINTFGIFTPILLTLFFLETSIFFAFTLFFVVILLGFAQRYLLDKFHILAVPRLSILLTMTIVVYTLYVIFADSLGILNTNNQTVNYFPIVIISILIERFSVYYIEEGLSNTLKTVLGTLFVSLLCYALLSIYWLKALIFNNPELLLLSIGLNIMIGSYKGYRVSEYFRFSGLKESK